MSIDWISVTSRVRPRLVRSWTDLYRNFMACIVCRPHYTLYDTLALGSTILANCFVISLVTGLFIFMMESVNCDHIECCLPTAYE